MKALNNLIIVGIALACLMTMTGSAKADDWIVDYTTAPNYPVDSPNGGTGSEALVFQNDGTQSATSSASCEGSVVTAANPDYEYAVNYTCTHEGSDTNPELIATFTLSASAGFGSSGNGSGQAKGVASYNFGSHGSGSAVVNTLIDGNNTTTQRAVITCSGSSSYSFSMNSSSDCNAGVSRAPGFFSAHASSSANLGLRYTTGPTGPPGGTG